MTQELLIDLAIDYLNNHSIEELHKEYFCFGPSSIKLNDLIRIMPELLYELYSFIKRNEHACEVIDLITNLEGDALIEKLLYIMIHGVIPLTVEWEKNHDSFYRSITVPVRSLLSDIMYAGIATMRCDFSKATYIESGEYSFLSMSEYKGEDDSSLNASFYSALTIYDLESPKLCYGYNDAWVFDIIVDDLVIVEDDLAKLPVILVDAIGFGIIEGNIDNVALYLENPNAIVDGIKIIDLLGVDFNDTNFDNLNDSLFESFFIAQYRYEVENIFDEEIPE